MSKKIKITEEQLKRLVVLKNQIQENEETTSELNEFFDSPAPGVVERLKQQITSMIMEAIKEEFPLEFDTLDEGLKAITIDQIFYLLKEGIKQDMGLPNDRDKESQEREDYSNDEPKYEMPGYQETMDNLNNLSIREDDDMINESVKKIKSTFKRFL
jgi:hypothetical protein